MQMKCVKICAFECVDLTMPTKNIPFLYNFLYTVVGFAFVCNFLSLFSMYYESCPCMLCVCVSLSDTQSKLFKCIYRNN